ncbi:MAG: DUF2442 domain-containing protein [Oscillospiraceae bacterium]|nr:DUF2442 domain-containing protein [Oscillospiraceae bacterium]
MLQPKIVAVEPLPDYKLKLFYETGEKRLFVASTYIRGSWYGRLKDESYFKTVRVLPDGAGVEWPEGQDIAPHELYDESTDIDTL